MIYIYLVCAGLFAVVTFSDDWHALVNDGLAITALSIASGVLVALVIMRLARRA